MFRRSLLPLGALLLWCASLQASWLDRWVPRGVVVGKIFRPSIPEGPSGREGVYKLEVRDGHRKIHRQMVSYDLFCAYEIGDQFDPAMPPSSTARLRQELAAEEKRASPVMIVAESPAPPSMGPPERILHPRFTQDMLPETEAF
jgi:hypothetical protein